jgi:hypothetical protein
MLGQRRLHQYQPVAVIPFSTAASLYGTPIIVAEFRQGVKGDLTTFFPRRPWTTFIVHMHIISIGASPVKKD